MSRREEFFEHIRREQLFAIVRSEGNVTATVEALWDEGVHLVEIALSSTSALENIRRLARVAGVGAGSVRSRFDAERALHAGASFLVSPTTEPALIEWAHANDVPHLPGVLTPTEIEIALRSGAGPVKLFPASVGGPAYVAALRGPFPEVQLVPTGGVTLDDAGAYLDEGAIAVAVGGALVHADSQRTRAMAAKIVAELHRTRSLKG